ncbi:hypothetical protein Ferp_1194 [Ferroglobus placidus DSM 10642]|uniref:Uncharacterized protein n=1 Tax=Ferroglobus placidus (strain DSM 10642 / AEDII12DO) TaxID=589924 RepID=D3RXY9_FERPA|nr:hypothetical protein [Ferroglobus placidus]ADC65352.1 hypothetical protein Ferp_1194 [Ferroglobus placidus DSM 10642]
MPGTFWDVITKGLGIKKYPALIVSSSSLNIEDMKISDIEYVPPPISFAKWERGMIADVILEDRDELSTFLDELIDAAKEGINQMTLQKKVILKALEKVKKDIKDVLVVISRKGSS